MKPTSKTAPVARQHAPIAAKKKTGRAEGVPAPAPDVRDEALSAKIRQKVLDYQRAFGK